MSPPDTDPPNPDRVAIDPDPTGPLPVQRARRPRSWVQRHQYLTVAVGVLAILTGLGIGLHIANFYATSGSKGSALVKRYHHQAGQAALNPADCQALGDSVSGPQALVEAPEIGLTAPVEAGVDDAVLNVAVGHVPGSAWPNQPGTTLLAAHDVSYFSGIDQLAPDQQIQFTTPCDTYVYRVTGHQIVESGSPLYSSPSQSLLILETCYPLNALYFTSQRYLVTASLVRIKVQASTVPTQVAAPSAPVVPAPPPLAAEGLSLENNEVLLGVLNLAGTPSSQWRQGPAPLADEAAALTDFFGGLRSAEQNQPQWWSQLAPSVSFGTLQPLIGEQASYVGSLVPTLTVTGTQFTGATIDVSVVMQGSEPGQYALHVVETVVGDTLEITQWVMQRQF
jgi:LPXTG-site transpeptidase (sortase) family protein